MDYSIVISKRDSKYFYTSLLFLSVFFGVSSWSNQLWVAFIPLAILITVYLTQNYRLLFFGLIAILPFSIELQFGSIGTDFPSEPILLLLTGIFILYTITNFATINVQWLIHPITIAFISHIFWIFITSIYSETPIISFKFLVAKLWYFIPLYCFSFHFLDKKREIHKLYKIATISLSVVLILVLIRHAFYGYSFAASNKVLTPIFRNHVTYASMIVVCIPYVWARWRIEKKKHLMLSILLFLIATYFSYTRAAYIAILVILGGYYIVKYQLCKPAIFIMSIATIISLSYIIRDNKFIEFAPDYNKTITHKDFGNLVEATYKLEDISTMERVYRWVAGVYMINDKPWFGFGPNGFYSNYSKYTISLFQTYVSDNPEKSGIHCYYLMTWVEQGYIGLCIFLFLCINILLVGERAYHSSNDPTRKAVVMAAILSNIGIFTLQIINDIIETDKVGVFFFINAAIIVIIDSKNRQSSSIKSSDEKIN